MMNVLSCRLPEREAELFRVSVERRGLFVSEVIRELVNRDIRETLEVGADHRSAHDL